MKSAGRYRYIFIILISTVALQGCTAINFGAGVALDPPKRDKQEGTFLLRAPQINGYTNTVTTNKGETQTAVLTNFLLQTVSGDLLIIRSDAVISTPDRVLSSTLSQAAYINSTSYFILDDGQMIDLYDIRSMQFSTTPFIKDSLVHIETARADTTLKGDDIDQIYLGFGTTFNGHQPDYADVFPLRDVVSIHYKEPVMNTATMFLFGIGIVTDVLIGTALLTRSI